MPSKFTPTTRFLISYENQLSNVCLVVTACFPSRGRSLDHEGWLRRQPADQAPGWVAIRTAKIPYPRGLGVTVKPASVDLRPPLRHDESGRMALSVFVRDSSPHRRRDYLRRSVSRSGTSGSVTSNLPRCEPDEEGSGKRIWAIGVRGRQAHPPRPVSAITCHGAGWLQRQVSDHAVTDQRQSRTTARREADIQRAGASRTNVRRRGPGRLSRMA